MGLMIIGTITTFLAIQSVVDVLKNNYEEHYIPCGIIACLLTISGTVFFTIGGLHG